MVLIIINFTIIIIIIAVVSIMIFFFIIIINVISNIFHIYKKINEGNIIKEYAFFFKNCIFCAKLIRSLGLEQLTKQEWCKFDNSHKQAASDLQVHMRDGDHEGRH